MVKSPPRSALIVQRLGVWLLWWAALAAVWMLLVDTRSTAELAACGGVSLAGLLLTALVSRQHVADLRLRHGLLLAIPKQALRVPADLGRLTLALVKAFLGRRPPGRLYSLPFEGTKGPLANGRRAATELIGSLAPNTIVLGVDDEQVVVHQLVGDPSARAQIEELA